jgi:tetratricopeptide repeat protein 30
MGSRNFNSCSHSCKVLRFVTLTTTTTNNGIQAPKETFANLLLLLCKYEYYDVAADVLAEHAHLTYKHLSQYLYDYLDAIITQQTSPDEAFAKFDALATQLVDELRKLTKKVSGVNKHFTRCVVQVTDSRGADETSRNAVHAYDSALSRYIPVIMAQAKIYWDTADYPQVERVFRKSVEFCSEHETWRLNVAHTLFMQETKFKEAAGFYEPIVKRKYDNILDVPAIVLANLCVCYIMTNQNEEAEELMRKVEKEEERQAYDTNEKRFHLCIINLVIGTLYCSKGNYEFGKSDYFNISYTFQRNLACNQGNGAVHKQDWYRHVVLCETLYVGIM